MLKNPLLKHLRELTIHVSHASVSLLTACVSCYIPFTAKLCTEHSINSSIECKLNFSDTLQSLVGQQNARHGIIKIFSALQETRANKHLLYVSKLKPRGFSAHFCLFLHLVRKSTYPSDCTLAFSQASHFP